LFFESAEIDIANIPVLKGRVVLNIKFEVSPDKPDNKVSPDQALAPKKKQKNGEKNKGPAAKSTEKSSDLETGTVTCEYFLHEALTNSVLCLISPSGPDVDSGPEGIYQVCLENDAAGKPCVTSTAGKHVRFSPECYFAEEQNAIALPIWSMAITAGLVRSVAL
jgi:hypothetical protein